MSLEKFAAESGFDVEELEALAQIFIESETQEKQASLKKKLLATLAAGSIAAGAPGALKASMQQSAKHGLTSISASKKTGVVPVLKANLGQSKKHGLTSMGKK